MKKALPIALAVLCLCVVAVIAQTIAGTAQLIITSSDAAVPVQWTNAVTKVSKVTIIGKKAERTANPGTVYIGPKSANDAQVYEITTGSVHVLNARGGSVINLADWYLDVATAGDGIIILYQ